MRRDALPGAVQLPGAAELRACWEAARPLKRGMLFLLVSEGGAGVEGIEAAAASCRVVDDGGGIVCSRHSTVRAGASRAAGVVSMMHVRRCVRSAHEAPPAPQPQRQHGSRRSRNKQGSRVYHHNTIEQLSRGNLMHVLRGWLHSPMYVFCSTGG